VSLAILWPRKWEVAVSPRHMIEAYIEPREAAPVEELRRDLSIYLHDSYSENREGLKQLAAFLQVASGLLALEVALWIVAIAVTL
ncbi:MAG TPA: hypothetical protein VFP21_07715, partial [Solirubrobacterales bacterium]|nr:hypothetical protein [Solirubrobacterales bacterium]